MEEGVLLLFRFIQQKISLLPLPHNWPSGLEFKTSIFITSSCPARKNRAKMYASIFIFYKRKKALDTTVSYPFLKKNMKAPGRSECFETMWVIWTFKFICVLTCESPAFEKIYGTSFILRQAFWRKQISCVKMPQNCLTNMRFLLGFNSLLKVLSTEMDQAEIRLIR